MEEKRIRNRKTYMYHCPRKPFKATSATDRTNVTRQRIYSREWSDGTPGRLPLSHTLASLLISKSSRPIFVSGCDVFMTALVSLPVYMTNPIACPAASTVLAHNRFSAVSPETKGPSSALKEGTSETGGLRKVKVPTKV